MKKTLKFLVSSALVTLTFALSQMHSSQAMEEMTPITLIQPDGKKIEIEVHLNQPLSDLRLELINKNRILLDDIFQKDGSDIYRDDEKGWTIRDAVMNNTLSLKPVDSTSIQLFDTSNSGEGKGALWGLGIDIISDLMNPLETFDLSQCGDTGQYLSISTGYRKGMKAENKGKVEIWLAPQFLIEKELNTTAKHFQSIFPS